MIFKMNNQCRTQAVLLTKCSISVRPIGNDGIDDACMHMRLVDGRKHQPVGFVTCLVFGMLLSCGGCICDLKAAYLSKYDLLSMEILHNALFLGLRYFA